MARILLVEDEPWLAELYAQLFGREHELGWARDGYDALDQIDSFRPHVIVLDILLPWVNGIQLLHELASYQDTAKIPVVVFSAAVDNWCMAPDVLYAYGVRAVIDKTTARPHQVLGTINSLLKPQAETSA